jgi:hypothetical protein
VAVEERNLIQWDPFVAMDALDDEAILAEMEGRVVKALVYEYSQNGQMVRGLSKVGVDQVVREMSQQGEVLREDSLEVVEYDTYALFRAKASRYRIQISPTSSEVREVLLDTVFGMKRQEKSFPNGKPNPFWYETGASKALRNARARLIREDLKQTIIARAAQEGAVRRVEPADTPERARPALATSKQLGNIHQLYRDSLKWTDEQYREALTRTFRVESSKVLTVAQANQFIKALGDEIAAAAAEKRAPRPPRELESLRKLGWKDDEPQPAAENAEPEPQPEFPTLDDMTEYTRYLRMAEELGVDLAPFEMTPTTPMAEFQSSFARLQTAVDQESAKRNPAPEGQGELLDAQGKPVITPAGKVANSATGELL